MFVWKTKPNTCMHLFKEAAHFPVIVCASRICTWYWEKLCCVHRVPGQFMSLGPWSTFCLQIWNPAYIHADSRSNIQSGYTSIAKDVAVWGLKRQALKLLFQMFCTALSLRTNLGILFFFFISEQDSQAFLLSEVKMPSSPFSARCVVVGLISLQSYMVI